jgi:YihY family inner membrane protein
MNRHILQRLRAIDSYQQRSRRLSFPVAVLKKFSLDSGGQLAGLIAFYGFFSLVPLLLVLVTVLGIVLHGDAGLQRKLLNTDFAQFPGVGTYLRSHLVSLHGDTPALLVGVGGLLLAGLGVTRASQTAFDRVWDLSGTHRYSFLRRQLRGLGLLAALGAANIVSTGLTTAISLGAPKGILADAALLIVSAAVNMGLFVTAFMLLPSRTSTLGEVWPGAAMAALLWLALQHLGGVLLVHLNHASDVTGVFALVIGLLTWLYLGGLVTLLAAELNVVRAHRLWPRSFL